jgi:ribosomal protein S18 acetylase RimI-like enzyme
MEKKHIKALCLMLSGVFADDMKDIFPDPKERKVRTPYFHEFLLRRSYSYSEAFVTSPKLEGMVVWAKSDRRRVKGSIWQTLTPGTIWPAIRVGRKALKKMEVFDQYVEKKHRKLAPFKHWYLAVLAVAPQYQGKGYGSKLLNGMLSKIDEEGLPCYVETEGEKNVSMYQHFGFKAIDKFVVPDSTETLVAMLRQPKTKKEA